MTDQSASSHNISDEQGNGDAEVRRRTLSTFPGALVALGTLLGVLLVVNKIFHLGIIKTQLESEYLYSLAGLFVAAAFLIFPASSDLTRNQVPWYDYVLAAVTLLASAYFVATARLNLLEGWEFDAPQAAKVLAFVYYILILEGVRRTGGLVVLGVVFVLSLYPIVADIVPGPISGFAQPLPETIVYHLFSSESAFGIPMKAFGQVVVGFIVFGATLQFTGGGKFFNDLAILLVGRYRGGAAKVSIFASGFMGSMSGSVISNVLTTGAFSIPAMKRTGFSARYAAGTEACASTGGVLMPPVMGSTAFVMASFIGVPYADIVVAAAIPSILFYFGLFVQIDAYSGRKKLQGLQRDEVPTFKETISEGWQFAVVFGVLLFIMIVLRRETQAPFYATLLLLVINQFNPKTRLSFKGTIELTNSVGAALGELVAILLGVGMIVGSFNATGLAGTIVNDLVFLAGNQTLPLLMMGALTAFIFGMGMTVTACYIFLAIVLAPALTQLGLDKIAVHLFILYWGMVSFITPPVALGAFAAASLAGTSPMSAGLAAMRLGSVIYILPFLFVLNPALVAQAPLPDILISLSVALIGVFMIGSSLQGYVARLGDMRRGVVGFSLRAGLCFGGILLAISTSSVFVGYGSLIALGGVVLGAIALTDTYFRSRTAV